MGETGSAPTAVDLGFAPLPPPGVGWRKSLRGVPVEFRPLRRVPELLPVEGLQREVMGVGERDLVPASELVVVAETGGEVLGAYVAGDGRDPETGCRELAGAVIGWGGWVGGRPRLVSDLLAVRAKRRNLGLGAELKRLQAAVALAAGFGQIVWTVDPLRAGNARLNFEKLGATADHYEENRYGAAFGAGLYGDLPSDRLHLSWEIASPRVRDRLLGRARPTRPEDVADLAPFDPAHPAARALVPLPANVDRLLADDPSAVLGWRLRLRETLGAAFAAGYAITGFVGGVGPEPGTASYVVERR